MVLEQFFATLVTMASLWLSDSALRSKPSSAYALMKTRHTSDVESTLGFSDEKSQRTEEPSLYARRWMASMGPST